MVLDLQEKNLSRCWINFTFLVVESLLQILFKLWCLRKQSLLYSLLSKAGGLMWHTGDYLKSGHPQPARSASTYSSTLPFHSLCLFDLISTPTAWFIGVLQQIPPDNPTNPPRLSAELIWPPHSPFDFGFFFQVDRKEASRATGLKNHRERYLEGKLILPQTPESCSHPLEWQRQVSEFLEGGAQQKAHSLICRCQFELAAQCVFWFEESANWMRKSYRGDEYGTRNSLFVISCHLSFERQVF